jgi:predicted ATP-grasp superfamily ATP-dependent carboligase
MEYGDYDVLLPMTDISVQLVSRFRHELESWVHVPLPTDDTIEAAQDKRRTLLLAQEMGIDIPQTWMMEPQERLAAVSAWRFPVVIKPRFSRLWHNGAWSRGGVEFVHTREELRTRYEAVHARNPYPLVQERIEGEGCGVFLLVWNGELKAAFCHRRLREKPPWGGVSVLSESVPLNTELVCKSYALLRKMGWHGPAMVEFKIDQRDGQPRLMEVNGRFWGSLQLAVDAGMDFPLLLYSHAKGEKVPAQLTYRVGVKSRWLLGDLDHLMLRLHRRAPELEFAPRTSRLRAVLRFLKLWEPGLTYSDLRLDDLRPFYYELKQYAAKVRSKLHEPEDKLLEPLNRSAVLPARRNSAGA